jgi:hypothetical protein
MTIRLIGLYTRSRRVDWCLAVIAVTAGLRWMVRTQGTGPDAFAILLRLVPLIAAGVVVTAGLAGPFGLVERSASTWLPWLRCGQVLATTLVASGAFALSGTNMRDLAGFIGLTLLTGAALGPARCWTVPLGYALACAGEAYLDEQPWWAWPLRAAGDTGALAMGMALLVAGVVAASATGTR